MEAASSPDVPLFIEPVTGWRVWGLTREGGQVELASLNGYRWPTGEPMRATCDRQAHDGSAPVGDCTCGIYATRSFEELQRAHPFGRGVAVIGTVSMWGRVVEHERGMRAESAYPSRLAIVCGRCLVEGRGMVPARSMRGSASRALCRGHGAPWASARRTERTEQALLARYGVERLPTPVERKPTLRETLRGKPRPKSALARWAIASMYLVMALVFIVLGPMLLIGAGVLVFGLGYDVVHAVLPDGPAVVSVTRSVALDVPIGPPNLTFEHPVMRPRVRARPERNPSRFVLPELVCGHGEWSYVELLPCGDPRAELAGSAERRGGMGAKKDCSSAPGWFAYTHGSHYFICWFISWTDPPRVWDWPTAPDPFADRQRARFDPDRWGPPPPPTAPGN